MDIKSHFKTEHCKRQVHIEQLLILRTQLDAEAKRKLDAKIERERQHLALIDEIWDVR